MSWNRPEGCFWSNLKTGSNIRTSSTSSGSCGCCGCCCSCSCSCCSVLDVSCFLSNRIKICPARGEKHVSPTQGSAPDETVAVAVYCPPVLSSNYMWLHRSMGAWEDAVIDGKVGFSVPFKLSRFVLNGRGSIQFSWLLIHSYCGLVCPLFD